MLSRKHVLRVGSCALALFAIAASSASAHATKGPIGPFKPPVPIGSPIIGHAYIDDNTTGANTIAGFYRHLDGSLTPIPGSPFGRRRRVRRRPGLPGRHSVIKRRPLPDRSGRG
jgi:hypothetical protein